MAIKTKTTVSPGSKNPAKPKTAKSNIRFGSLKGKMKVAPDTWDEDLRKTITE